MSRFHWINDTTQLTPLVEHWRKLGCVFVDTEFHRERTFYPLLALIQLSDGTQNYLIEPKIAKQCDAFVELLSDSNIRKVFHSASEDCEVLYRFFGVPMQGLFDTQIAGSFIGLGVSIGYAAMVESLCDVSLAKGWSRSDWMQRPLTEQQLNYAVDDVEYLASAYVKLIDRLKEKPELASWIEQDCAALESRVDALDNMDEAYLDVKNAWKLNKAQLIRLYHLSLWREHEARDRDLPKTFILKNDELFELSRLGLTDKQQLPFIDKWHPASRRRHGKALIDVLIDVEQSGDLPENFIAPLSPKFWQAQTQSMQVARDGIESVATTLGLESEVLCSKKLLRQYVSHLLGKRPRLPRAWTKMREQNLGPVIRSAFEKSS
ncbi:ribonuclease D [Pleionea litopenaei]|uniref:Ribonuclease D n=1 Tax=Pleionea litopenaei TaxID=3070815 RepID=A0AA51X6Y5_9GAMM|nr:ribonuclease D [Pleionea sp. HL-JVS1]WMS87772.1 ribonuclease D [Pleionea sp. HL-JVS1]